MRTFAVSKSDSTTNPLSNLTWLRSMMDCAVLAACSATSNCLLASNTP